MESAFRKIRNTVSIVLTIMMLFSISSSAFASKSPPLSESGAKAGIDELVPYMRINESGFFALDQESIPPSLKVSNRTIENIQIEFSEINAHLKEIPLSQRPRVTDTGQVEIQGLLMDSSTMSELTTLSCIHVERWVLDTIGWTAIIYGAGAVTIGLFVAGTIVGIPVGAILQALGLWEGVLGTYFLWYVDQYYPYGVDVC